MKTIIFNIGLTDNTHTIDEIIEHINEVNTFEGVDYSRPTVGSWQDQDEPMLVVYTQSKRSRLSSILQTIENMCVDMNQTAIAAKIDGVGYLVYNYTKQPEQPQSFDEDIFIG